MSIKITFLGAARSVTGSRFLLEAGGRRILVDCGLFQERHLAIHNWERFVPPPASIDAVVLTHSHLDHCGYLPKLVREGFDGPVYCTPPTGDITRIMLLDSASLQAHDAEQKRKRHVRDGRQGPHPEIPLYTVPQAEAVFPLFRTFGYEQTIPLARNIRITLHDAGHVLGAAMVEVRVQEDGTERVLVFSGDIGRWDRPILRDPTLFDAADYLLMESTYANRELPDPDQMFDGLVDVITATIEASGKVIVPSFALERSQEILYYLYRAARQGRLPSVPVYLDSPMAVSITEIFARYAEFFDEEMQRLIGQRQTPFDFPGLHFVQSPEESHELDQQDTPAIIIAGSGMCTGGRIKYHLTADITRPESTILFVGYQAVGTLGRQIVDGAPEVRILGEFYPVKARIVQMSGFSSHADSRQLLRWLYNLKSPPRKVFVVHGEPESADHLVETVRREKGWNIVAPALGDEFDLD